MTQSMEVINFAELPNFRTQFWALSKQMHQIALCGMCCKLRMSFRRRERAMQRFGQMKALQKFASVHANVYNHFNQKRHLTDRQTYKTRRSAANDGQIPDHHTHT